jgi:hypothetical protein
MCARKGQKNDFRDAEAIAEAVQRPRICASSWRWGGALLRWRLARKALAKTPGAAGYSFLRAECPPKKRCDSGNLHLTGEDIVIGGPSGQPPDDETGRRIPQPLGSDAAGARIGIMRRTSGRKSALLLALDVGHLEAELLGVAEQGRDLSHSNLRLDDLRRERNALTRGSKAHGRRPKVQSKRPVDQRYSISGKLSAAMTEPSG